MLTFSLPVLACKLSPVAHDLRAFLSLKNPQQVVFVARVERVEEFDGGSGMRSAQRITFRPSKWWRGKPKEVVNAVGHIQEPRGTSCDGISDFTVYENEEWLIVGTLKNNTVSPLRLLSIRLKEGELPQDALDALENTK